MRIRRCPWIYADATRDHHAIAVVQGPLFALLRLHYERRDTLRMLIDYRKRYLDLLLIEGEEAAETVTPAFEQARAGAEREYAEAAEEATAREALSEEDA